MRAIFAAPADLDDWMALVQKVSWNFPGLETEAELRRFSEKLMEEK